MKLKQFVKNLNKLMKEFPETAELDVITARDDEGNGYNMVHYAPSVGHYNFSENSFFSAEDYNAVCVN